MKDTIKNNWNTESFNIHEMMNVVNNYFANKDKFPRNQRIPSKKEIENRLIDAHRRIENKSLFGFGFLTGLGYGTLTREDNIKIDETLQIFSQMEKAVDNYDKEMKYNEVLIEGNQDAQKIALASDLDKKLEEQKKRQRKEDKLKRKDPSHKKKLIDQRKRGLTSSFKQATGRLLTGG